MKKLFSILLALVCSVGMWAASPLTLQNFSFDAAQDVTITTNDANISVHALKGSAGTNPGNYNSGIRLYQASSTGGTGGYLTITGATGVTITSVAITTTSTYSSTTFKYSTDGGTTLSENVTIASSSTETISSISSNGINIYCTGSGSKARLEISKLVITYTGGNSGGGDTPTSSITAESTLNLTADADDNGTFEVTWTNLEDYAVYLYNDAECTSTFTGDWFVAEVNESSDNIDYMVEENTGAARTVYMQLYALDSETEEYTKVVTVTQAAALPALTSMDAIFAKATEVGSTATDVKVTLNNWVVSGVKNNNAYVTDNNGKGFIIFGSGHGFAANDKLNGTVTCKVQLYNGSAELTTLTSSSNGLTVTHDGVITPQEIAIASLTGANTGAVLTYNNLAWNGTVFSDGVNTITPYNTLTDISSLISGRNYNVTGVYLQYNSTKEILPRSAADMELVVAATYDITVDDNVEHGTISADKAKASAGEVVTLSATPASTYELSVWTVTDASSNSVTVTNNKFTMPASDVTVTATFVKSPYVQVFYESFDTNAGTGGNDDKWSGSIASNNMSADHTWTGAEKVNGANQCIKLGTGSAVGYITSPELPIVGTAKIRFRAGGWAGNTANFTLSASNGTLAQTSFTPKDSEWDDYEVIITGADHPTITFNTGGKRRIFLDEVYALQKVVATISVSSVEYATYYNSTEAYVMPEGLEGITVTGAEGTDLTLTHSYASGSVVPADEALLLHGEEGDYTLCATETVNGKVAGNMLMGTDDAATTTGGDVYYGLGTGSQGVGFYWVEDEGAAFTNGAHKAYLAISSSNAPARFIFGENPVATDVENVATVKATKALVNGQLVIVRNGAKFNLNGMLVK